jgi:hypothetical protein
LRPDFLWESVVPSFLASGIRHRKAAVNSALGPAPPEASGLSTVSSVRVGLEMGEGPHFRRCGRVARSVGSNAPLRDRPRAISRGGPRANWGMDPITGCC